MKDRVREAIFNLIGPEVQGKHAFDLFAGTGVVGFEAISRGAAKATMLERHFPTARSIKDNAELLGIKDQVEVAAGDSFVWVKRFKDPGPLPWLVFCCPPYSLYIVRQADQLDMIDRLLQMAPAESIFVVESDERFDPSLLPEADQWDVRSYPPTLVAIYRKRE
jgi:16S rRNA (guanine966-N2)-methyltransferase